MGPFVSTDGRRDISSVIAMHVGGGVSSASCCSVSRSRSVRDRESGERATRGTRREGGVDHCGLIKRGLISALERFVVSGRRRNAAGEGIFMGARSACAVVVAEG